MNLSIYIFSFIGFALNGESKSLKSWIMLEWCDADISRHENAGELHVGAEHYSWSKPENKCHVTIKPPSFGKTNEVTMILFYFTAFELPTNCDDANISVSDARDNVITGLPRSLCGINTTLTEPNRTFTSAGLDREPGISVTLRFRNIEVLSKSNFSLKYVTYHTDACIADSEYECSNGRCIPDQFKCLDDLDACGEADVNCSSAASEVDSGSFFSTLGSILKHFLFFMLFVGGVVLIKHMADRFGRSLKDSCGKGCFQMKNKTIVGCRAIRDRLSCISNTVRNRLCPVNPESSNATTERTQTHDESRGVTNQAFSAAENTAIRIIIHARSDRNTSRRQISQEHYSLEPSSDLNIEPPSYDEVMVSENVSSYSLPNEDLHQGNVDDSLEINNHQRSSAYCNPYIGLFSRDDETTARSYANLLNSALASSTAVQTQDTLFNSDITTSIDAEEESLRNQTDSSSTGSDVSVLQRYIEDFYSTDSDWDQDSQSTEYEPSVLPGTSHNDNIQQTLEIPTDNQPEVVPTGNDATRHCVSTESDNKADLNSSQFEDADEFSDDSTEIEEELDFETESEDGNAWGPPQSDNNDIINQETRQTRESGESMMSHSDVMRQHNERENTDRANHNHHVYEDTGEVIDKRTETPDVANTSNNENETIEQFSSLTGMDSDSLPELPPHYDDAVPPPYYYDYIANVKRYNP